MSFFNKKNIYLDYAGATPIDKGVLKVLHKTEKKFFANGSAIYNPGIKVRETIEESRLNIAKVINAHSDEIIFTGSGTESDALAIFGVVYNYLKQKKDKGGKPHIITSAIEHPAVLENVRLLEERGLIEATYLPVLENGIIDLDILKDSLKDNTILVSVMYANNEIGTIQPIEEIAKIIRHFRKTKQEKQNDFFGSSPACNDVATSGRDEGGLGARSLKNHFVFPVFHTDACQAMNYLFTENIEKLGVDLLSFNSSKIYGPKGIGVLYKKRNIVLDPLYSGGGQEFGLRSGTESVSLIRALDIAFQKTNKIKNKENKRLEKIRDYGIKEILKISDQTKYKIILNGDKDKRLPNNINISISDIPSELFVIELSALGIYVSEKSACKSESDEGSYVIKAIRRGDDPFGGSIRITLGRQTRKKDMDTLKKAILKILSKYSDWK